MEGKRQVIYWKDCWVKVYKKGERVIQEEYGKCDGYATVIDGLEIVLSGRQGVIKET